MNQDQINELRELIARAKSIQSLPVKARKPAHETELSAALDRIRNEQLDLFKFLTQEHLEVAKQRFFVSTEGTICMSHEYRDDIETRLDDCVPPRLPKDDIAIEAYNELIADCENGQASVFGGFCELVGCQVIYQETFDYCQSIYKALTMNTENEWDGKATFMLMLDSDFVKSKIRLDNLVAEYDARLKWFQSVYASMSRQVSIKLGSEPGEMRRGTDGLTTDKKPSWRDK
jgi:hypothetical protein